MAQYNVGNTGVNPSGGFQWSGTPKIEVIEYVIDLSKRTGLNVPAAGYLTGDTLKLFDFQKGTYVIHNSWELLTAEGAAMTFTLGDSAGATTFTTSVSANGTPNVPTAGTTLVKLYTANDYALLTLGGTLNGAGNAKIAFHFVVANCLTGG